MENGKNDSFFTNLSLVNRKIEQYRSYEIPSEITKNSENIISHVYQIYSYNNKLFLLNY